MGKFNLEKIAQNLCAGYCSKSTLGGTITAHSPILYYAENMAEADSFFKQVLRLDNQFVSFQDAFIWAYVDRKRSQESIVLCTKHRYNIIKTTKFFNLKDFEYAYKNQIKIMDINKKKFELKQKMDNIKDMFDDTSCMFNKNS